MPDNKKNRTRPDQSSLESLLQTEHQSLVHWLHDELGQNLVAIKSFAAAIIEQNQDADDDTAELAEFIRQAADLSYRSTYDLMQELRAEAHADLSVSEALQACLQEARLKQAGIEYHLDVGINPDSLDSFILAVILRCVRGFINFSKQSSTEAVLSVGLHPLDDVAGNYFLKLQLTHQGELDSPPEQSPGLTALRERIEALDGRLELLTDHKQHLDIIIKLKPLSAN